MKPLVLLAAVCVIAAAAAAAPAAVRSRSTTVEHLRSELRALRSRVHTLTVERSTLRAAVASATRELAKTKEHPTAFETAVEQVRHEVQWAAGSTTAPLSGQLISEAAMDYVVGHVSTGAYGYLELVLGEPPGGPDLPSYWEPVNSILTSQTGICVHAERTFAAIVRAFHFRARDVGFDFVDPDGSPDSHAAAEVSYGGAWHFFDPTFGQFWTNAAGDILSIAAVRSGGGIAHVDGTLLTNLIEDAESPAGGDAWFETDPATTLVIGRSG